MKSIDRFTHDWHKSKVGVGGKHGRPFKINNMLNKKSVKMERWLKFFMEGDAQSKKPEIYELVKQHEEDKK